MLLAGVMTPMASGTNTQEPIIYQEQQASEHSYVAGSQLLTWWGQQGDVELAVAQLGGVQQCSEGVNARVDSEFFEDEMLTTCRQETAGYDMVELLQPSEKMAVPSEEQTTRLCRSEACAAWLSLAVAAPWLPECRYRQSQTSFRSLAETVLRIRKDLVATAVDGGVVAPNASLFREFYVLNQLANLLSAKEDVWNEGDSPAVQVARQMTAQEDFSLMGSGDSTVVEPPGSTSGTENTGSFSSPSTATGTGSSTPSSSSNSNSVGDFPSGSDFNSSDTAGFTSSGIGPHASSTATTTELTPSYAYVVGAWVLFNGSYFFLMRRK